MTRALRRGLRRAAGLLVVGAVLVATGCGSAVGPVRPAAADLRTYDLGRAPVIQQSPTTVGMADSDLYGLPSEQVVKTIGLMTSAGVHDLRIMVPWAAIERDQGRYDWSTVDPMVDAAVSQHVSVLATLNSPPAWAVEPGQPAVTGRPDSPAAFGRFAEAVAEHYRGKVSAYEIWNEPNSTAFFEPGPDPAGYVDLLKAAYPAIKAADPSAVVVSGGLGPLVDRPQVAIDAVEFVRGMYAAGAKNYFDALAYHPYQYTMKFSEAGYHPDSPVNQLVRMRDLMLLNGDLGKRIWATEYGEPSVGNGEGQQAAYLQDMMTTWRTIPYAGPLYVYTMRDRNSLSGDPEDTLGIYRSDGTPKPAVGVIGSRVVTERKAVEPVNSAPR
jgi:hypothetical protein